MAATTPDTQCDTTVSYVQRLSNVISALPAFTKDTSGYNYKYVTLDSIQKVLTPLLAEHSLVLIHSLGFQQVGGEAIYGVTSRVIGTIEDECDRIEATSFFPIKPDASPQDIGSARTYGMRYNITALFNIILVGEDDDGASASKKPASGGTKTTAKPSDSDW